ncbi:MAG: hypothetical protein V5A40_08045 [Haloarculaceae archaeon]
MAAEPTNRTEQRTNEPATAEALATVEAGVAVEATVTLRVPRGAMGDLPAGVHEVLAGVNGVETADVGEIHGVRPTSFDIRVDVAAWLGMDETTDSDAVRDRLLDGFGIEAVEAVVVDVG